MSYLKNPSFDVSIAENLSSLLKPLPPIKQTPSPSPLKKIIEEKIKQILLFPSFRKSSRTHRL